MDYNNLKGDQIMTIQKLENGSGTGFSIIKDGQIINFKLAVFSKKKWFHSDKTELVYGFVTDNGLYAKGTYSGGVTGLGLDAWEIEKETFTLPEDLTFVTSDLSEIIKLAEQDVERVKREREEFNRKQNEAVEKINQLPKFFLVEGKNEKHPDWNIFIYREDYDYKPGYSNSLQGNVRNYLSKEDNPSGEDYWNLRRYYGEGGRILSKSFIKDNDNWFKGTQDDAYDLLVKVRTEEFRIKRMVQDLKK